MTRTLVVYDSRDGHTRKIAREIGAASGGELEEICDASGVPGPRSYLRSQRAALGRVAFFCTSGGAGQDKVLRDMQALCGQEPVATLALSERQCAANHDAEVSDFVHALQRATRAPHDPSAPPVRRIRAGVQHGHSPS